MILTEIPTWEAAIIIVGVPTAIALLCPPLVRRFVALEKLQVNNEVAGFKFATVGVLYAVLLAFVVVVVWEKFNEADTYTSQEAAAAATIYRMSASLPREQSVAMQTKLTAYLEAVLHKEFPAMQTGHRSPAATTALDAIYDQLLNNFKANTPRDTVILAELLRQLDVVTQSRRARLVASMGLVPGVLWAVLIMGAIATLGFTLFFGAKNLGAQSAMTGILSLLLFSGFLVVVSFDHPFSGSVRVRPHGIEAILNDFGKVPEPNGR